MFFSDFLVHSFQLLSTNIHWRPIESVILSGCPFFIYIYIYILRNEYNLNEISCKFQKLDLKPQTNFNALIYHDKSISLENYTKYSIFWIFKIFPICSLYKYALELLGCHFYVFLLISNGHKIWTRPFWMLYDHSF